MRHGRRGGLRRGVVAAAVAVAALAVAHAAAAHSGFSTTAETTQITPRIDGVVGGGEWSAAAQFEVPTNSPSGSPSGTAYAMTDGRYLYLAFQIPDPTFTINSLFFSFDNDHDGEAGLGDDGLVANLSSTGADDHLDASGNFVLDTGAGGTDDLLRAASYDPDGPLASFEVRQPLCSSDTAHDICVEPGGILGFHLQYWGGTFFTGFPSPSYTNPRTRYGDLAIALFGDVTPPETEITAGPTGTTETPDATFEFSSNEPGATFECSLDGSPFEPCSSPRTYTALAGGAHTFTVRAVDGAENVDPSPAIRDWSIGAEPIVVDSADDVVDAEGCTEEHCSLREAILEANASPGADTITFSIGSGPQTIAVGSPLPVITDPVAIDATTQPGYEGAPLIRLDGAEAGPSTPGFEIIAGGTTIRGFAITSFSWDGVKMLEEGGNVVEGNYLGLLPDGVTPAGNGTYGVLADFGSTGNTIRENVVAANGFGEEGGYAGVGVWHGADDNEVLDNTIGAGRDGTPFPNAGPGLVVADSSGTLVEGNTVVHNGGDGILVIGDSTGSSLLANSIDDNDALGIDLGGDGVTPNDPGDGDFGPNELQNFPVLTRAERLPTGHPRIRGTLSSTPFTAFRIDYYSSPACDGSGLGEGARWLGTSIFSTDEAGTAVIDTQEGLTSVVDTGDVVTATATSPGGSTSELSACVTISDGLVVNSAADPGTGGCDESECTLREAIEAANAEPGSNRIVFDIPGEGVKTIQPATALPAITEAVTIDGYTQPGAEPHGEGFGSSAVLQIEVDGSLVPSAPVLELTGSGSTVRGLVLNRGLYGIAITGAGATLNRVAGNFVGTDPTGTESRTNGIYGVLVRSGASQNTIGGDDPADRNLVSGNTGSQGTNGWGVGIALGATGNTVAGNWIGTAADGIGTLPNAGGVILLSGATDNTVGGPVFPSNFIVGNSGEGVRVQQAGTTGNVIRRNFIGVSWIFEPDRIDVGNGGAGVHVTSGPTQTLIEQNTIANSGGPGVGVSGGATGVRITGSRIRNSGGLGIDLGNDGVTPNDPGDADTGPNGLQNFPVLTGATAATDPDSVTVAGTLSAAPNATYAVELFQSPACDPSGHGEGEQFRGGIAVTTDETGEAAFSHSFSPAPPSDPVGTVVTATATDANGDTSEFSACQTVMAPPGAAQELSLTVDEPSTGVGAATVPLSSVPFEYFPLFSGAPQAAPIPSSAVAAAPIPSSPIPSSPIPSSPIPSSPIPSSPIPSSGLAGVPDFVLDQILLSSLPGVDWADILGATVPLQTLTLLDVRNDAQAWADFSSRTVGELGLERTVFRNARFLSFFFGGITLDRIPPFTQEAWCAQLTSCNGVDVTTTTILGLDLAGYLASFETLGDVTIGQIGGGLASSPIPSSPIPSSAVLLTTLASLPIPSSDLVDCSKLEPDCLTKTLGDAARAGALGDITWADVLPFLGDMEMAEFVTAYLGLDNLPWESWPIDGFQSFSGIGRSLHYRLDASFACPATSATVNVLLGHGFLVKPGSSTLRVGSGTPQPIADPATDPETGATWALSGLSCPVGAEHLPVRLAFEGLAGFRLGTFRASASVTGGSYTKSASEQAPVTVVQNWELDDDLGTAPLIEKDTLVIGSIPAGDELDARRFQLDGLEPGTVVQVYLRPPAETDLDLYLSKPGQQSLLSSPIPSSPIPSSPIPSSPLEDPGGSVNTTASNLPPEGLADAPIPSSEISSSSISRSDETEVARVIVNESDTGFLRIAVAGYNGAHSPDPYTLRVKVIPPPELPDCVARSFDFAGTNGTLPVGVDPGTKTLFLLNRSSMERTYGAGQVGPLLTKLAQVAARGEVAGAVVEIDGDLDVRAAKQAWDAEPCSVEKANGYVQAINALLAGYRGQLADLENVVLVGGDEQIAMARVPDLVADTNESTAAVDLAFTTAGLTQANALYASLATGHVLTDAVYGAATKIPFLGRELYLEENAVGRLVETPAEIVGALQQYLDSQGLLDLDSSFTTGYDFMKDGAEQVDAGFAARVGAASAQSAISDSWGAATLSGKLSGAEPGPPLFSPNAHTNHWQLLPAFGGLAALLSTGPMPALGGTPQFPGAVVLTIGCHAGLNVADTFSSGGVPERQRDWAQSFLQNRAAVYVANTGYGYGHFEAVALSERLFALLAHDLGPGATIGQKWVQAKQEYFSTMGAYDVYDEKTLIQATFYGLPFWRFEQPSLSPLGHGSSSAPALVPDPLGSGLQVASFSTTPTLTRHDVAGRGSYWTPPDGDLEFHHRRSLQPRLSFAAPAAGGQTAHGVRLRALTTGDVAGVDQLYGNATIANAGREPEPQVENTFWPASPISIHRLPSGDARVVFVAGQSRPPDVQRLFTHAEFDVLYSSSTDLEPPEIAGAGAVFGNSVTFWVQTRGGAVRSFVLFTAGGSQWQYLQLQPVPGTPGLFSATVDVDAEDVDFAAGAEDAAGNVGYIFNKGVLLTPVAPEAAADGFAVSITSPGRDEELLLNQPAPAAVYGCASPAGVRTCTGPVASGTPFSTGSPGTHQFTVSGTDVVGNTGSLTHRYRVAYRFSGFRSPLTTGLNAIRAGQTVPVKWTLTDFGNAYVRSPASVVSITSAQVPCPGAAGETVTETASDGAGQLRYDTAEEQFVYNFRTERDWAGSCRRLTVALADGSTRTADFRVR